MSNVRVDPIPLAHYTTFVLEFENLRPYNRLIVPCSTHHGSHMSLAYITHQQHRYLLLSYNTANCYCPPLHCRRSTE